MAGARPAPAVTVTGGKELRRALKHLEDGTDDLKDANQAAGQLVADEAETLVPVDSGLLRSSIRAARQAKGASVLAGSGRVPYAAPIHFGWRARNIEPQPFLYDALDNRRDEVVEAYAKQVGQLVKRFDREAP